MADTLDVLTIGAAVDALKGMRGASDEQAIPGLVTAVSRLLDEMCGPIVARLVTETHRDPSGTIFLTGKPFSVEADPEADPPVEGTPVPIVTEAWSNETPSTVLAADYLLEDDGCAGRLTRWAGYWGSRVTVTYTAGRYATTDDVGEPFKKAAQMLLQHLWRRSDGGSLDTYGPPTGFVSTGLPSFTVPNVVSGILVGELLPPTLV